MQYTDTLEQSTQHLRQALPLMSRLGIPITPPNYAVWYEYVANENPILKHRIDQVLGQTHQFTDELMSDLFNNHVVKISEEKLNHARSQLQSLMSDVGKSIASAGSSMESYQQSLHACSATLDQSDSTESILQIITRVSDETADMMRNNCDLQNMLDSARQEAEKLREELKQARDQAFRDPLTGLANRHGFDHYYDELRNHEEFSTQSHSFLMADIDNFKTVNDSHGHLIGDKVIKFISKTMLRCVKGKDIVARFGGDEMGIFFPNTSAKNASAVAQEILASVEKGKLIKAGSGEHIGQITISAGIAELQTGESLEELIQRADESLYTAKKNGRNRIVVSTPESARRQT